MARRRGRTGRCCTCRGERGTWEHRITPWGASGNTASTPGLGLGSPRSTSPRQDHSLESFRDEVPPPTPSPNSGAAGL